MPVKGQEKEKTKIHIKPPRQYNVIFYNDDFTPMDFVVEVLVHIFDKTEKSAIELMLEVHHSTSMVVGEYPKEIAKMKVKETVALARSRNYPLMVEAVPQED